MHSTPVVTTDSVTSADAESKSTRSHAGTPTSDGLAGVVAARTALSHVDGSRGELLIAGADVEELAPDLTFEQMINRLLGIEGAAERLPAHRALTPATLEILDHCRHRPPMDALRIGVGSLELIEGSRTDQALSLLAKLPSLVASHDRLRRNLDPGLPPTTGSTARALLEHLSGSPPSDARVRALDTYLNTVCDHGMNASTFTARVIASTGSDLVSALTGAIGALKGPLHGGAPGPALDMVFEVGRASRAESILRAKLENGERLMGFGHRIYRVRDPRADVLASAAHKLAEAGEHRELFELARAVEQTALRLLAEFKPDRKLDTNVEFYTALLLHGIGLESGLFTPTFAVGRALGWIAHCFEQMDYGKLIRPDSVYVGPRRPAVAESS